MDSEPVVCERFSATDSDITIRSSDGVLFKVHRNALGQHSDGFPAEDMVIPSQDEVVDLTETSETLELLLQYIYPSQAGPHLASLPTNALFSLADAAEKYNVPSAIAACMLPLTVAASEDPIRALQYGATHECYRFCDDVALQLIRKSVQDGELPADISTLGPSLLTTWRVYREQYAFLDQTFGAVPEMRHLPSDWCKRWEKFQPHIESYFLDSINENRFPKPEDARAVFRQAEYYTLEKCFSCVARSQKWSGNITKNIPHNPKSFSEILRG